MHGMGGRRGKGWIGLFHSEELTFVDFEQSLVAADNLDTAGKPEEHSVHVLGSLSSDMWEEGRGTGKAQKKGGDGVSTEGVI